MTLPTDGPSVAPARTTVDGLARIFHDAASSGELDSALLPRPIALGEGLRIQLEVLSRHIASGQRLGGWKVGLTSGPARDKMGTGFRPFGYILESRIFQSGSRLDFADFVTVAVEPELCFTFNQALHGAELTPEDIARAIQEVVPAFEIHHPRLPAGSDPGAVLADDLGQWGIVVGRGVPWACTASQVAVELRRDETIVARVGPDFSIDEPTESIARLCASLAEFGLGIEPGHRVITGAFHHSFVEAPGTWRASFQPCGDVEVSFV